RCSRRSTSKPIPRRSRAASLTRNVHPTRRREIDDAVAELAPQIQPPTLHYAADERARMRIARYDLLRRTTDVDLRRRQLVRIHPVADRVVAVVAPTPHVATFERARVIEPARDVIDTRLRDRRNLDAIDTALTVLAVAAVAPTPFLVRSVERAGEVSLR